MQDDDPRIMAAEASAGVVAGTLATFGGLDPLHTCAIVVLAGIYVAGLFIRLRLRSTARRARAGRRDTDTID